jgi:uncharacterized protein YuzE
LADSVAGAPEMANFTPMIPSPDERSGIRGEFPRGRAMKLHYYPETDSLYIELTDAPGAEAHEIVEGLVVDFDADGNVVGLDIDHASRKLDLSKVETIALPPASAAEWT